MRERREVAAGTYRALFRNHRMHTPIEHVAKQLDYFATNSAESERQHRLPHLFDSCVLRGFVADDSAFTYALATNSISFLRT